MLSLSLKMWFGLIGAGYLVIATSMVGIFGFSIGGDLDEIQQSSDNAEDQVRIAIDEHAGGLIEVLEFHASVYQEQAALVTLISASERGAVESSFDAWSLQHTNNSATLAGFQADLHFETDEQAILTSVAQNHLLIETLANKIQTALIEDFEQEDNLSSLATNVKNTRNEVRNVHIRNDTYGSLFFEYIEYDYNSKTNNRTGELMFNTMRYHEKEFLWQYRDDDHKVEWQADMAEMRVFAGEMVDQLGLPPSAAAAINDTMDRYAVLGDDFLENVSSTDLERLLGELWATSGVVKDLRNSIRNDYLRTSLLDELQVKTNITGTSTTGEAAWHLMRYEEKEYLWQYRDEGHRIEWEEGLNDTEAIFADSLTAGEFDDLSTTFADYRAAGLSLVAIAGNASDLTESAVLQRSDWLDELSDLVVSTQSGNMGLEMLISEETEELEEAEGDVTKSLDVSSANVESAQSSVTTLVVGLFIGFLLLGALATMFLNQIAAKPIIDLTEAMEKVSKGDFDIQLDESGPLEAQKMAEAFSRMVASMKVIEGMQKSGDEEGSDEFEAELEKMKAEEDSD